MRVEQYAIEYVDNVPKHVHVFHLEARPEDSTYQALVSLGAFDTRMTKACLADPNVQRYWIQRQHEWDMLLKSDRRLMVLRMSPVFLHLPKTIHQDLWAFYRAIGWDYKSKRFLDK